MNDLAGVVLKGKQCFLRPLTLEDVSERYVAWMNDPSVTRFLETRFTVHTLESIKEYVRDASNDPNNIFMAICLNEDGSHIGNIKLGPINRQHSFGTIGLMIGEKDCWGKGYATQAIELISRYAFEQLKLHKLMAGCYVDNTGSLRAFEKVGFTREGVEQSKWLYEGKYIDGILLSLLNSKELL